MTTWTTSTGGRITAATKDAAEKMAAEYGMGDIVGTADMPARPGSMTVDQAREILRRADQWSAPTAQERAAEKVLQRNGIRGRE